MSKKEDFKMKKMTEKELKKKVMLLSFLRKVLNLIMKKLLLLNCPKRMLKNSFGISIMLVLFSNLRSPLLKI